MARGSRIELPCPAKVNLALSVGAPAPDGLHPIASWMVALDFADRLVVEPADGADSHFDIAFEDGRPVDWPLEKDLAHRSHALLEAQAGRPLAVRLSLRKRIPTGAGLGGGSSNAAATLVAVDRCFDLNLGNHVLSQMAACLGSDVGFLLAAQRGVPSAVVGGFGEQIEPVPLARPLHLALVMPAIHCGTKQVYGRFDAMATLGAADPAAIHRLAARGRGDGLFNDLAEPACAEAPPLATLRKQVTDLLGRAAHVTGSGSALFVPCEDADAAQMTARRIASDLAVATVAARTVS